MFSLGYTAKDGSFYASLRAGFAQQDRGFAQQDGVVSRTEMETSVNIQNRLVKFLCHSITFLQKKMEILILFCRKSNESAEGNEGNISTFIHFLKGIKDDYKNGGMQLRIALDKFADHYKAAKLKSIPRLVSFLYDLNRDLDPTSHVKSGSMIRVQIESVKRRKTESSGSRKRKLPNNIREEKENLDPYVIPARKKRATAKKVII